MAVCLLITMVIHIPAIRMISYMHSSLGRSTIPLPVMFRKRILSGICSEILEEHGIQLEVLQEDKEIPKKGTVTFFTISYYSSSCVSVTKDGEKTAGMEVTI